MDIHRKHAAGLAAAAITLALTACSSSSSGPGVGEISVGVSDSAVHDAAKVCINFNEIELKGAGQALTIPLDPDITVNLLEFQGMNAAPLIMDYEVEAGQYQWMRFGVNAVLGSNGGAGDTGGSDCDGEASYIAMQDGSTYNLYIPSGAQSGLKFVGGFLVPVNGSADFTAEIDLMKSIANPTGLEPDVIFRPTLRVVNNAEAGTLTGQVANELAMGESCAPSVYVFDDGVMPNPIDDGMEPDPDDPVATALVEERTNEMMLTEYHYTIGFLLPGEYEVAFTCDGEIFEPAAGKPATIEAKGLTTVNF